MSDQFHTQPWASRYARMGDASESRYEETVNRGYVRFGLNRPRIHVPSLPKRLRFMPDYLEAKRFVECVGFGRDGELKLKTAKYDVLRWWETVHPVELFVYDSKLKRHTQVPLSIITELVDRGDVRMDKFHEGNAFYGIDGDVLFQN